MSIDMSLPLELRRQWMAEGKFEFLKEYTMSNEPMTLDQLRQRMTAFVNKEGDSAFVNLFALSRETAALILAHTAPAAGIDEAAIASGVAQELFPLRKHSPHWYGAQKAATLAIEKYRHAASVGVQGPECYIVETDHGKGIRADLAIALETAGLRVLKADSQPSTASVSVQDLPPTDIRRSAPQKPASVPAVPSYAEKVIAEHNGCGQGPQGDMLTVSMWPGDQIVQRNPRFLFLTGEKAPPPVVTSREVLEGWHKSAAEAALLAFGDFERFNEWWSWIEPDAQEEILEAVACAIHDQAPTRSAARQEATMLAECYEWLFESKANGPRVSEGALTRGEYTPEFRDLHDRLHAMIASAPSAQTEGERT